MSNGQKRTLFWMGAIVLIMILFPPWTGTNGRLVVPAEWSITQRITDARSTAYAPLWDPPGLQWMPSWDMRIAYGRLVLQFLAVGLIGGGVLVALSRHEPSDRRDAHPDEQP